MSDDKQKAADRARRGVEKCTRDAKSLLVHFFKEAIPDLSFDAREEIEGIVDKMIEAAVFAVEAERLEAEIEEASTTKEGTTS